MTFKELRALSGMSQRKFASYFHIPRRTIENWDSGDRACPTYTLDLMKYKLEQEGIIQKERLT
jgi:DNA-binding transcriptional regulator YiaG